MKKLSYITLAFLLTGFLFIASCKKDDTTTGSDSSDRYVGTWICMESDANSSISFKVIITKTNSSAIAIANFHALGNANSAVANVSGNIVSFPTTQTISGSFIVTNALGSLDKAGTTMTLSYTVNDQQTAPVSYNATCTKQ